MAWWVEFSTGEFSDTLLHSSGWTGGRVDPLVGAGGGAAGIAA
jgi:hypothetical protein